MILINLLPHREAKRARRKTAFLIGLAMSALVGLAITGAWWAVVQQMVTNQQARNQFLDGEIKKLDAQIRDIANLRSEIDALKARQKSVEDLQTDRNIPVHLLNELAKQVPEGVYLSSIKQTGATVLIAGSAQTNERVSELLRNTANSSSWLERPELVEIKSSASTSRDPAAANARKLYEFSMRVSIKRPQAPTQDGATPPPAAAPAVKRS